ncbi:MAG: nucleotide pyrophosphohydrolase [Thermoplasmata archaeon]
MKKKDATKKKVDKRIDTGPDKDIVPEEEESSTTRAEPVQNDACSCSGISDRTMTIERMKAKVRKFNEERSWGRYHNPKDLAIALIVEAAELLECFQWKNMDKEGWKSNRILKKEIADEMADVLVYLLDMSDVMEIDLAAAFYEKMKKNEEKYPACPETEKLW